MKKSILFIINPISGTKSKGSIKSSIEKYLDKSIFDYEIRMTEYAGHAAILTKEAVAAGYQIIAAVGGDGTINEVARSIVHTPSALAIIPCGSGNGLARHLHIPLNVKKAIEVINQNTIVDLDYGKINGHPFFCTCGLGFDAFVSLKFAEGGKRGFMSYANKTLKEGIKYKPETYIIEDENGREIHKAFLIACANASQYGNNAYIAPNALMNDGLMDVIILEPFNTLIESPQILMQLFNKTLPNNSHVKAFQAKKIRIIRPSEGAIHCDGDPMVMGKELEVEIINKSFKMVINPQAEASKKGLIPYFSEMTTELIKKWEKTIEPIKPQFNPINIINNNPIDSIKSLLLPAEKEQKEEKSNPKAKEQKDNKEEKNSKSNNNPLESIKFLLHPTDKGYKEEKGTKKTKVNTGKVDKKEEENKSRENNNKKTEK